MKTLQLALIMLTPAVLLEVAAGQLPHAARGTVVDEARRPLPGVRITFEVGGRQEAESSTESNGTFVARNLRAGPLYRITLTKPGYEALFVEDSLGSAFSPSGTVFELGTFKLARNLPSQIVELGDLRRLLRLAAQIEDRNRLGNTAMSRQAFAHYQRIAQLPTAGPMLVEAIKDPDSRVRQAAAHAMHVRAFAVPGSVTEVLPVLHTAVKDPNARVRYWSALLLANGGADALPLLTTALKDADAQVRAGAAGSLGVIRADASSAIAALKEALNDEDGGVRSAAKLALERLTARRQ